MLDDCARLREILKALPRNRHYIPVLICLSWSHEPPNVTKDFDDMVNTFILRLGTIYLLYQVVAALQDNLLRSHHEFAVSSGALDTESKLEVLLRSIAFDRDGCLVQLVSVDGLLPFIAGRRTSDLVSVDIFEGWGRVWDELTTWLTKCTIHNDCTSPPHGLCPELYSCNDPL